MKSKIKKILISFVLIIFVNFVSDLDILFDFGMIRPDIGLLYVLGLFLGPYGALGAVLGDILVGSMDGSSFIELFSSAIFSFGVSYLAYKLWYSGFKSNKVTKPILDNFYHFSLFLSSILVCGFVYAVFQGYLLELSLNQRIAEFGFFIYFFNFINVAFILGIIGIWLSKKIDFIDTPKVFKKSFNKKLYRILFYSLIIVSILLFISFILDIDYNIVIVELILDVILLFAYLTKPFEHKIELPDKNTIIEKIINSFIVITLAIAVFGVLITYMIYNYVIDTNINLYLQIMPGFIITDMILLIFLIPTMFILKYIENKIIVPISSFSEIEKFIKENEKIETEGLVNLYSRYVDENNEIGILARSYTELIEYNNNYIENIREIEGEKKRIEAELDIATRIQASRLPTEAIKTNEFIVNGYSHPAKEVGGDFFDYYMLDEDNLAIVIGDASGKGVPAALLAMITQVMIKQLLKDEINPSKVLYLLNDQICENNSESMFLTLWLGIYNKTTKKLIFSNAGHNPPLIKSSDKFKYMDIDSGIVLGVMEDFEFVDEELTLSNELVLYTDGITDANNIDGEMYGEDRLLNFFNEFKSDDDPINPLLNNIRSFTEDAEQYDDMTLVYLRIK
ncbi:PP2C family protein-serine/threonine phosphatase [Methanobrevibacter sp.]|uniref:PP2C family protein-serine/threonine phosphatase n=1 Tax=Methanobrevibacter sp. TaxID=66852 RepID=UPI0039758E5A